MISTASRAFRLGFAVLSLSLAPSAAASEILTTTQSRMAGAEWLPWAPMPAASASWCLVDTGVDEGPETAGVVVRESLYPGGGADYSPIRHGSTMALAGSAPANGVGIVGLAPQAKVVSVRATPDGNGFPETVYRRGIDRCQELRRTHNIVAINLSLGGTASVSPTERDALATSVRQANDVGVSVIGAVGNDAQDASNIAPANVDGVIGVAASGPSGRCSFSNFGSVVDVAAPGCGMQLSLVDGSADPSGAGGTSAAAALTSASLAALRSYRPDLSREQAEQLVTAGGALNVAAAFEGAGRGDVVAAGRAAMPVVPAPAPLPPGGSSPIGPGGSTTKVKVATPRLTVRSKVACRRRGCRIRRVVVVIRNFPRVGSLELQLERRRRSRWRTVRKMTTLRERVAFKASAGDRVRGRFLVPGGEPGRRATIRVK